MYYRCSFSLGLVLIVNLTTAGCVSTSLSRGTLPSSSFFAADPSLTSALQTLVKEQEQRIKHCSSADHCQEAYYTRALVALFHNRADAITAFQELRTMVPDGRHAASSTRWLYLLQESSAASSHKRWVLEQLREEVLHGLVGRGDSVLTGHTEEHNNRLTRVEPATQQKTVVPK